MAELKSFKHLKFFACRLAHLPKYVVPLVIFFSPAMGFTVIGLFVMNFSRSVGFVVLTCGIACVLFAMLFISHYRRNYSEEKMFDISDQGADWAD